MVRPASRERAAVSSRGPGRLIDSPPRPGRDSLPVTPTCQIRAMTTATLGTAETDIALDTALGPSPNTQRAESIAAHVIAGGSPFDLVARPDWFSYSTFDSYERCPRQYALRYLCRLQAERPRPAADFGSVAHAAFEKFTRERRERPAREERPPDRSDLGLFFEAAWAGSSLAGATDSFAWRERAEPMLDSFWERESVGSVETIGEELRFRLTLALDLDPNSDSVVIAGYIDRVDRLPTGEVELIDYKTGRAGSPQEASTSLQLSIYALGCRDALGLGRPARVSLDFVEHGLRFGVELADADLDRVRDRLVAEALEIRESGFSPTPSDRACGWCDYAAICPSAARPPETD
jgi:RecB family exonuclease